MAKNAWGDEIIGPASQASPTAPGKAPRRNAWGDVIESNAAPATPATPEKGPDPSEGMSRAEKVLVGAGHAVDRAMRGMSGLVRSGAEAMGARFDPDDKAQREAEDEALYQKYHPGSWATAGEVGADVAMSALPVVRVGSVLTRALAARGIPLAAATGDIAANAAYSAATAPEDRSSAAAWGAGGAAGGRVLSRALAARAPKVAPGVQELADRGVSMTPGQLYGPGVLRSVEDKATSIPGVGDLITRARKRSLESYNRAELEDVLAPLARNDKVTGVGKEAVEQAESRINDAYEEALKRIYITPDDAVSAARSAVQQAKESIPMLDPYQAIKLDVFVGKRIEPWAEKVSGPFAVGNQVKEIDAEIGHYARKFSRSQNPSDHALGEAFYILQANWRGAMQASGKTTSGRDALELLQGANEAYRNLLPLKIASERTQSGVFTPQGATAGAKTAKTGPSTLTQAARQVLPSTVPDSGSAGRLLQGVLLGDLGSSAVGVPLGTLSTAAAATAALTSRPAMRGMTRAATAMSGKGLMDVLPDGPLKQQLSAMDPAVRDRVIAMLVARLTTQQQQQGQ